MPTVVAIHTMLGLPDPSGLAYDPVHDELIIVDSEIDEEPTLSDRNLATFERDGVWENDYSFGDVSREPVGVAYDPAGDRMFVVDDDTNTTYVVDRGDPDIVLGQFSNLSLGVDKESDVAMGNGGNVLILSQNNRMIYETGPDGSFVSFVPLPSTIKRPEAMAYDAAHDVFYIGGGWSADLFMVSRSGTVLGKITELRNHPHEDGSRVVPKGLALAPSSDNSGATSLFVADYGVDQVADGRLIEIKLDGPPPAPPPPSGPPVLAVIGGDPGPQIEGNGATITFTLALSAAASQDVVVTYGTANGTAEAGKDFIAVTNGQAIIAAGQTTATVTVQLQDDTITEGREEFSLVVSSARLAQSQTQLSLHDPDGTGFIDDDDKPKVHQTSPLGSPDPAGLTYNPYTGHLLMVDSEVDEAPFNSLNNLLELGTDGSLKSQTGLIGGSDEATGVAFWRDPFDARDYLFVTDDDEQIVFKVAADAPAGQRLASFSTLAFGCADPEDVAVDPTTGNLFVVDEGTQRIFEVSQAGSLVATINLPAICRSPEAIAYDSLNDVFYVGGFRSADIFQVSRSGELLDKVTVLRQEKQPDGSNVKPKGLVLAPATSGSGNASLFVADYGQDQIADGRLWEIELDQPAPTAPDHPFIVS